jgi:O-antigen/teichoic acid export membrane protein
MKLPRIHNTSGDSILLAIVKLMTTVSSLLMTMVLSKALSLSVYGTFVQCVSVMTIGSSISIFGLADASNYFFNRTTDIEEKKRYVNNIFFALSSAAILAAIMILTFGKQIASYFSNPGLQPFLWLIAFRPLLMNTFCALQVLHVAIGKARSVMIRNLVVSLAQLAIVLAVSATTKDLRWILSMYLALDVVMTGLFFASFVKQGVTIRPCLPDWMLLREIFAFSLPMAAYILMNTLLREMDRLMIGGLEPAERLAIYANCSKILPFDFISASFLTILVPIITRLINGGAREEAKTLFSLYLKIGYTITWILTTASLLCSRQMIVFLYSDKYLPGEQVFILYVVVEMVRFANASLVLSASGKTRTLMYISGAGLIVNGILNYVLYQLIGFSGPAVATVVVTLATTVALCWISAKTLGTKMLCLFDFRQMARFLGKTFVCAAACLLFRYWLVNLRLHSYIVLFAVAGAYCALMFSWNYREIRSTFARINRFR